MYIWMNKNNLVTLAVPCSMLGESKRSHRDRIIIVVVRRMMHHAGLETKEVLRRNVYHFADFMRIRQETPRWSHEHEKHYNTRVLRALEAARVQGVVKRV